MVSCDEDSLCNRNLLPLSKFASGKLLQSLPPRLARNFMCVVRLQGCAEVQDVVIVGIRWPASSASRSEHSTDTL